MGSNIKEIHKQIIIEKSIDLFVERGIDDITMTDIALEVGIGEATLYRYFGRKQNIVILCAIHLWESVCKKYLLNRKGMTGLDKITSFYTAFFTVYYQHKEYLGFIYELDNLLVKEKIDRDLMMQYEVLFDKLHELWISYYQEGLKDHTVKNLLDPNTFYLTSTHAILTLCKKLARETTHLSTDNQVKSESEIKMLIEIVVRYISNI